MNLEDHSDSKITHVLSTWRVVGDLPSRNKSSLNEASTPAAFAWRLRVHVREKVRMNTVASNTTINICSIASIRQGGYVFGHKKVEVYLPLNRNLS